MKIGILKKARKRFSIIRVDRLGHNPEVKLKNQVARNGLPVYILRDRKFLGYGDIYSQSYKKALELLLGLIKSVYNHKDKSIKIWHNDKIT